MDEWDDELSELPVDRRRIRLRRGAYWSLIAGLITLIILTIVFVGKDTTTVAAVGTNGTTTTTTRSGATGFATSLPVGVTATSLSGTTTTTASTTTTTAPRNNTTTTTTAPTTTTQAPPPFFYPASHNATGTFTPQQPAACPPITTADFIISTPSNNQLSMREGASSNTGTAPISPSGVFSGLVISTLKHTYSGTMPTAPTPGTQVPLAMTGPASCQYDVLLQFSS